MYRMVCRTDQCSTTNVYFDERGELAHQPKRVFRRSTRPSGTERGLKRWCQACGRRNVRKPSDRRVKYCNECLAAFTVFQLWQQQQCRRDGGESRFRLRRRLSTGSAVKRLRAEYRLTQSDLAARARISVPLLQLIEARGAPYTRRSRGRLIDAFLSIPRAGRAPSTEIASA